MSTRTIEARLVISGEDRASLAIHNVVKTVRQLEDAAKVSRPLQEVAKSLHQIEQAEKAVNAAMSARSGFAVAEAGLRGTQAAAAAAARSLDDARRARAAFDGVKATKGSDQARQIEAATRAVREAGNAHRKTEGEVRRATAAVAAQSSTLQRAEAHARAFGADLTNLESHQQRLRSATESATNAVRAQMRAEDQAAGAARRHSREQAELSRHRRSHGLIGAAAAAGSGAVGIHGVTHTLAHGAKAGAEVQSTRVDMAKAGIPFSERQHIADESLKLATTYKNVTQAGVMELWKEMRSVMTDPHEVDHVIDSMVRAKSLLDARDSTNAASHGLNLLVKGAENIGAAKDPDRFNKLIDGYVKAMQVMGKTITPEGIYEAQKYSKAAGGRWSDRFIMTTMQSLGQEMGGSTAGNSVQMAQKQIVGGMQNQHSKAKQFASIGLIDPKNLDRLKTGEVKGVKAGVKHAVKGDDLAATDFDQWVYTVLLPHMEKAGIKKQGDQLAWVQKSFTSTAADVVSKLIVQRESFDAHAKMYENATGLKGTALNRSDPNAALGEVTKSLETFLGVVTSPIMVQAAHGLDNIATTISGWSVKLDEFNKAHPDIAKVEAPVAAGAAVIGAGGASALTYKLITGGFGLKGSAVALDGAAAALTEAAVLQGAKAAAPAAAPAAAAAAGGLATFGILGTGAIAGAYLDSQVTNGAGELQVNRDLWEKLTSADKAGAALGYQAPRGKRPLVMPGVSAGAPVTSSFRVDREGWFDNFLNGPRTDTYALPGFGGGRKMVLPSEAREAGQKAGDAIKQGLSDKAPEVEQQGRTLYERLKEVFSQGILIPMSFAPGEGMGGGGGGLIQKASYGGGGGGGGGLGGLIQRGGAGGGSSGGGGTALGSVGDNTGAGSGSDYTASVGGKTYRAAYAGGGRERVGSWLDFYQRPVSEGGLGMSLDKARAMVAMTQGESGINLNPGSVGDHGTSIGTAQWRLGRATALKALAAKMGKHWTDVGVQQQHMRNEMLGSYRGVYDAIQRAPTGDHALAIGIDRFENPAKKALAYRFRHPYLQGLRRDNRKPGGPKPEAAPTASGVFEGEKDLRIPEPPVGGFGGSSGSRGDMRAAAERMHDAADRMEGMGFHGQIQLAVTGSGRDSVRATGIRTRGRGGMSADLGISMPGAKESDGDWV